MGWGLIGDGMGWGPEVTRELVQDDGVIHGVGRDAGVGHTARGGRRGCPGVTGAAMAQPPPPAPQPAQHGGGSAPLSAAAPSRAREATDGWEVALPGWEAGRARGDGQSALSARRRGAKFKRGARAPRRGVLGVTDLRVRIAFVSFQRHQRRQNHADQQDRQGAAQLLRHPPGRLLQGGRRGDPHVWGCVWGGGERCSSERVEGNSAPPSERCPPV